MKLSDMFGSINTDPSQLHTFIKSWYRPEDLIYLVGIPQNGPRGVMSIPGPVEDFLALDSETITGLSFFKDKGQRFSLYLGLNPIHEEHKVSLYSRGGKKDVGRVYGVFIDLDVKPGSFDTKDQAYQFLNSLPIEPTILVDNGVEGGLHAYWRLQESDVHRANDDLLLDWWSYIAGQTDRNIDKLVDTSRITRMPSGIYWPKDGGSKTDIVRVVKSDGPRYTLDELNEICGGHGELYRQRIRDLQHRKMRYARMSEPTETGAGAASYDLIQYDLQKSGIEMDPKKIYLYREIVERSINENMDWADILEPHGWTYLKDEYDGARVFARPGKSDRSAVVDHVKDNNEVSTVMSLLSDSEMTNLSDLKEARIPLTKYQVILRLNYQDDEARMIYEESKKLSGAV